MESRTIKARMLCGITLALLPVWPMAAKAAEAESATAVDAVVVTGQRALSTSPQEIKEQALGVVDSVGALEIEQLTDTTVADALRRLPGVNAYRGFLTGKSWYVNIRGFDGAYNSVDLDGGAFFDSTRNNRAVYLDTIPANAINQLQVFKTVTPDMDPNSIGGHVSIQTLRAFDLGGAPINKAQLSIDGYSQNGAAPSHNPGYTADAVIKRTFGLGGDFGLVLAASAHSDHSHEVENNVTAYTQQGGVSVPSSLIQHGDYDLFDRGYSLLGKLEARSQDKFYGFVEASYFDQHMTIDAYRGNLAIVPARITNATEGTGDFTGATAQAFSYQDDLTRKLLSVTSGAEYALTSKSKLSAVLASEVSDHDEIIHQGSNFNNANISGNYRIGDFDPVVNITSPTAALTNPANYLVTPSAASTVTKLPQQDNIYTARLDYNYNSFAFSRGLGISTGVSLRRLRRQFRQSADNYTLPTGTAFNVGQVLKAGPASALNAISPTYIDYDAYWAYILGRGSNAPTVALSSSYHLVEDAYGAYAAAYYTTERLRLIIGARYEVTALDDDTAQVTSGVMVPFSYHREYASLLPNVQAAFDINSSLKVRAAYTQTIARPNFSNFAPGQTINTFTAQNTTTISGANPDLKARISDNVDLTLESYLGGGYLSVGIFNKRIRNEVYTVSNTTTNPGGGVTTTSVARNAGRSTLNGLEASVDWRDFARFAPQLDGFGVRANVTYLVGRLHVLSTTGVERVIEGLPQQPRYQVNLIGYYERGPFFASLDFAARGLTFNSTIGATPAGDFYILPNQMVNGRLAYRVNKGVEVFLSARNIGNNRYSEATGANHNLVTTSIQDGQTYMLGAQLKW